MKRLGRKRLAIDIPDGVHRYIQECASRRNITLTKYILKMIVRQMAKETDALRIR